MAGCLAVLAFMAFGLVPTAEALSGWVSAWLTESFERTIPTAPTSVP